MIALFLTLGALGLTQFAPTTAEQPARLLSRWVLDLKTGPETPIDHFQRVYLGASTQIDADSFMITSLNGRAERRLISTGRPVWSVDLEAASSSLWAVDSASKRAFAGDSRGNIWALDLETGAVAWKTVSKGVFFSKPLVTANQIYLMNAAGLLQAFSKDTGRWIWQQEDAGQTLGLWSSEGPQLFQNYVVAGFPSGNLKAFDSETGALVWTESFQIPASGTENFNDLKSIQSSDNLLLASSFSGDLKAWGLKNGGRSLAWQKKLSLHAPVTVDAANKLVFASARDGKVYAFDLATGFQRWAFELPGGLGTQPSLDGENIWVATSKGLVLVLNAETGVEVARPESNYGSNIWIKPLVVAPHQALVVTGAGILRSLKLRSTL